MTAGHEQLLCLNLLSRRKPEEDKLSTLFENLLMNLNDSRLRLINYDFHAETEGGNLQAVSNLIMSLRDKLIA